MNTRLWVDACLLLVTYVSVFCDCSALTLQCDNFNKGYTGESSYFYRQLESALLRNPNALYALHTAFFEPNRVPREVAQIALHLNIDHMGPSNCTTVGPNQWPLANGTNDTSTHNDSQSQEYKYFWRIKWSYSSVLSQIDVEELLAFDNILTVIFYGRVSSSFYRDAHVTLDVPSLPCKLTRDDVLWTVTNFLTWVSHLVFTINESVSQRLTMYMQVHAKKVLQNFKGKGEGGGYPMEDHKYIHLLLYSAKHMQGIKEDPSHGGMKTEDTYL